MPLFIHLLDFLYIYNWPYEFFCDVERVSTSGSCSVQKWINKKRNLKCVTKGPISQVIDKRDTQSMLCVTYYGINLRHYWLNITSHTGSVQLRAILLCDNEANATEFYIHLKLKRTIQPSSKLLY